ncbi:MAG: hypothetical protein ACLUJG_10765 [Lawsonibacter sp.]
MKRCVPYALYILDSSCTLTISGKTATAKAWKYPVIPVRPLSARYEWSSAKSGSFAWILVDSWTDRQDGTRASVSETVSVTPGETYRVKRWSCLGQGSDAETATIYSETAL